MASGSWVQQTVWGILKFIIQGLTGEWSNQAWSWFSYYFSAPVAVLGDPLVQQLTQVAVGLVFGFLPVAIGWLVFQETLARMDGTSITPPEAIVRRAIMTGATVTATSLVAWFMVTLAELVKDVLAGVGLDINLLATFFRAPSDLNTLILSIALTFAVGSVVLVIQRLVVTAEFTVLLIMGPVMAAGLIRQGGETTFGIWLREVLSLLITPLIQMLTLLLFIRKFAGPGGIPDYEARLASLALLWVLWQTPRWARRMVYSVGAGDAVVNGALAAGRMVVLRQLVQKAAMAAAAA